MIKDSTFIECNFGWLANKEPLLEVWGRMVFFFSLYKVFGQWIYYECPFPNHVNTIRMLILLNDHIIFTIVSLKSVDVNGSKLRGFKMLKYKNGLKKIYVLLYWEINLLHFSSRGDSLLVESSWIDFSKAYQKNIILGKVSKLILAYYWLKLVRQIIPQFSEFLSYQFQVSQIQ